MPWRRSRVAQAEVCKTLYAGSIPAAASTESLVRAIAASPLAIICALGHTTAGVPLSLKRLWSRLCWAVAWLARAPAAVAASETGFADQAHFTRTARHLLVRTPGELHWRVARTCDRPRARDAGRNNQWAVDVRRAPAAALHAISAASAAAAAFCRGR
jgi:AraC-like DNA-binding protein